jgi:phenylacetate-CoA ligase
MIREAIARQIGFPLQDLIMKTDIIGILRFLRKSQYWDEQIMEEYRNEKLKRLISHAYSRVPYYKRIFDEVGLEPEDIKTVIDLGKIPILTKETVRYEGRNLIAGNFDMKHVKKGKTGGTTGAPVIVYKDVISRSFTWASYYRWYEWMGVELGDRTSTLWGARTVLSDNKSKKIRDLLRNTLQNKLDFNSFNMSEPDLQVIYNRLKVFNPKILKGYLSALLILANFIENNELEGIKPAVVSSTSEMLLPHNRAYLERIFNAPVFDQYGCGEVSAISYECASHNGLHVNMEHVICEILDENYNTVVDKSGKIVVTDLDNYVMPFIRFENGDLGSLMAVKCGCGVNQPLMRSIEGRDIDTIILKNGSKVHGVFFTDIFFELGIMAGSIQRFQIYQNKPGEIEFRLESKDSMLPEMVKNLGNALAPFFNGVKFSVSENLGCDKNGKFRYIINESPLHK